jgi:hypothetical protein
MKFGNQEKLEVIPMPAETGESSSSNGFSITLGKGGVGKGAPPKTEPGLFTSQVHNGAKYQCNNTSYEKKGINIGIGGRIIHSDHDYWSNRATNGCIGIERKYWPFIFDQIMPRYSSRTRVADLLDKKKMEAHPVFVWDSDPTNQTCGNNSARDDRPRGHRRRPGRKVSRLR